MKLSKLIPEIKKGKCKYCGNPYIHFDLHWANCEGNPERPKEKEVEV